MTRKTRLPLYFLISLFSFSLSAVPFWLESENMTPVLATLEEGWLRARTKSKRALREQIRTQLHFTVGQLNAVESGPALGLTLNINFISIRLAQQGHYDVKYRAEFVVGWKTSEPPPESLQTFLPWKVDHRTLEEFYETYVEDCGLAYEEGAATFFFYFRPTQEGCPIPHEVDPYLVVSTSLKLAPLKWPTPKSTTPEYSQVWRDGVLRVTAYFSETEEGFPTGGFEMEHLLRMQFGEPRREIRVKEEDYHFIRLFFTTALGELEVILLDVTQGHILTMKPHFAQRLKRWVRTSDLVTYNGHAGYGKKLNRFIQRAGFRKGGYKLIFLNGCDTLTYVDDTLLKVRPTHDIITTGLSGYFSYMPMYTLELIQSLLTQKDSYQTILSRISIGTPVLLGRL